jgi:hypothetical protein
MRITPSCFVLALLSSALLPGQNAKGPTSIERKFDTPQARVIIATLRPHMPIPARNGHPTNRVVIYLDQGTLMRQDGEEKAQIRQIHRGDVRWTPASGAYVAENQGDEPLRVLEIDLLAKPSGPAPVSNLDPVVVDPKHYKVEFENEWVRVLRVHYDPHDKGALHQHLLNRVVLYLNDQPGAKADEVRMSGAGTHTEENASDQPADRIAVELK